jgi:hypothetical protein
VDLSQEATINDSLKLARAVLGELGGVNDLHRPHVEQAGFAVLKAPDIPSILVETAFLTNPEEEKKLKDDKYQDRMAQAILLGIRKVFFGESAACTQQARAELTSLRVALTPGIPVPAAPLEPVRENRWNSARRRQRQSFRRRQAVASAA